MHWATWIFGATAEMLRLDYLSCVLTVLSTLLIGKKLWHGWIIAGVNSVVICVIGMRTAQFGFVPANLFCIALYANNLWNWRPKTEQQAARSCFKVEQ
jgi:hypothetical protein